MKGNAMVKQSKSQNHNHLKIKIVYNIQKDTEFQSNGFKNKINDFRKSTILKIFICVWSNCKFVTFGSETGTTWWKNTDKFTLISINHLWPQNIWLIPQVNNWCQCINI